MNNLLKLSTQNLLVLKNIYKSTNWPLHVVSLCAINHFIRRFKIQPKWEEKVQFLTLNESWKKNGTFAMVNENDKHILFKTLEPWPHKTLRKTLQKLNYVDEKVFICFRDDFRSIVFDVMRICNLEITFDSGTKLVYLPREKLEKFYVE
jgi:hypothetical protein